MPVLMWRPALAEVPGGELAIARRSGVSISSAIMRASVRLIEARSGLPGA
jgi:hypothetical protein